MPRSKEKLIDKLKHNPKVSDIKKLARLLDPNNLKDSSMDNQKEDNKLSLEVQLKLGDLNDPGIRNTLVDAILDQIDTADATAVKGVKQEIYKITAAINAIYISPETFTEKHCRVAQKLFDSIGKLEPPLSRDLDIEIFTPQEGAAYTAQAIIDQYNKEHKQQPIFCGLFGNLCRKKRHTSEPHTTTQPDAKRRPGGTHNGG
jgi:hypothetical protein